MNLLDGKKLSETMLDKLELSIRNTNIRPVLGVVLVGNDPASHLYVTLKERAATRIGVRVEKRLLHESASQAEVEAVIRGFNEDASVHGILVQLPLPVHLDTDAIIQNILPEKDADGFHPENERKFLASEPAFFPVFPRAILELAKSSGETLAGKRAVVIGNSLRFGEMMRAVFAREHIVSECFLQSEMLSLENIEKIKNADIVVSACGKARMITDDMLKSRVILIDGGTVKDGDKVVGDVDRASVEHLDGWLSPVPGGVGPVTIACLLKNVVEGVN